MLRGGSWSAPVSGVVLRARSEGARGAPQFEGGLRVHVLPRGFGERPGFRGGFEGTLRGGDKWSAPVSGCSAVLVPALMVTKKIRQLGLYSTCALWHCIHVAYPRTRPIGETSSCVQLDVSVNNW